MNFNFLKKPFSIFKKQERQADAQLPKTDESPVQAKKSRSALKKFGNLMFENDRIMKIVSVLLAILIWYLVFVSDDTEYTQTIYNVPITVTTEGTVTGQLGFEVVDGLNQTVDVKVRGRKAVVSKLNAKSFTAIAKLFDVTSAGTYELPVEVSFAVSSDVQIVSQYPSKVKAEFDKIISKSILIRTSVTDFSVEEGYISESSYCTPQYVTVVGPETKISDIVSAYASASAEGQALFEDTSFSSEIVLYDKNSNKVSLPSISTDYSQVQIILPVKKQKEIPLALRFLNQPSGLNINNLNYTMSSKSIIIAGKEDEVEKISELNLGYIDMKDLQPGDSFVFKVSLPADITNISRLVSVTVMFPDDNYDSRTWNIKNIVLLNKPNGFDVDILSQFVVSVNIVGDADVLDTLSPDSIVAEIDMSQLDAVIGTHTVPVKINIPGHDMVWSVGNYNATINIKSVS